MLERVAADETLIDRIDPELLRRIDETLDLGAGWRGEPGPMARLRSIVASTQKHPPTAERRVAELLVETRTQAGTSSVGTTGRAA